MKLIFIHGSGCMGEMWQHQTDHFVDADAPDLPGHPEGRLCRSADEYARWVLQYIVEKGYKDVVLAGHSLGGAIVQLCGLLHPGNLKGIILVATGARLRVLPAILEAMEADVADRSRWDKEMHIEYAFLGEGDPDTLAAWRRNMEIDLSRFKPGVAAEIARKKLAMGPSVELNDFRCSDGFDLLGRVQEIKLPTLVIVGTEDVLTPPKYAQHLAGKISGAKLVVIEGASHWAPVEKPAEVNRAIEEFLRSL